MREFERTDCIAVDLDPEDARTPRPERRLFQAVIVAAVQDCLGHSTSVCSGKVREDARRWVGCDLFDQTCDLAGLDAETIRRKLRKMIADGEARPDLSKLPRKRASLNNAAYA